MRRFCIPAALPWARRFRPRHARNTAWIPKLSAVSAPWPCTPGSCPTRRPARGPCRSIRRPATCSASTEHAANLFALKEMGWIYTRLMNPTTDVFEQRMAALDGGVGALAALQRAAGDRRGAVQPGPRRRAHRLGRGALRRHDHAVRPDVQAAGHRRDVRRRHRSAEHRRGDPAEHPGGLHRIGGQSRRTTCSTIAAIADVAHARGLPVVCDNTVLTPVLFRPFEHGIDIAVYSATKFIGGHGTSIGGVIVDSGKFDWTSEPEKWPQFTEPDPSYHGTVFHEAVGPAVLHHHLPHALAARPGRRAEPVQRVPVPAGLETLHLRMPRHCENALAVAEFLEDASAGHLGQLSRAAVASRLRAGAEVPAQGRRRDPRLRHQGRARGGPASSSSRSSSPRTWPTSATPRRW